jgi:hypothetical protein
VVGIPVLRLGMYVAGSVGCILFGLTDGSWFSVVYVERSFVFAALPTTFL